MASRCQFWLPKKKRFCSSAPLPDSSFCGNHTKGSDDRWIICPIDPSHSVLRDNLESHLKKCPLRKLSESLSLQPYYQKGINTGTGAQDKDQEGAAHLSSEMKRKAVYARSVPEFFELIHKIKYIHASICIDEDILRDSFKIPGACAIWTNRQIDRKLPFQEKHVMQQASILGNLEHFGLLEVFGGAKMEFCDNASTDNKDVTASVVEFGAGRGYLTQMLADCYGIKKVLLVERKSYKLKADRSLRQIERLTLERLRIDIEDLNLGAVETLKGITYLAIGKHLCGPATDMTLKCVQDCDAQAETSCFLKGLAIATCCHHLCQWKHYINKKYMSNLGLSKEDFHAMTWFTSWAIDADHHSDLSGIDTTRQLKLIEKEVLGHDSDQCEVGEVVRNMKAADRALLGFMCKDIIDAGRLTWIKEHGLQAQMVKYVPPSISPENHLLIARRDC